MRTTIDIDDPILEQVKRLQRVEDKSLGQLVSELLGQALRQRASGAVPKTALEWTVREMGARYELSDSDAMQDAMDDMMGIDD